MKLHIFVNVFGLIASLAVGQEAFKDNLEQIQILGAEGPPGWDANWKLTNGYTLKGQMPTLETKCYSSREINVEVFINTPMAEISKVQLMNRKDGGSTRMKTLQAFVCQDKANCQHCGNCPDTTPSAWCKLDCADGPLKGNQIKLHNPTETVDFCEVYILGENLELARTPISVLGGEGSNAWSTGWVLTNGYSTAGQAQTPNTCYCSAFCQDAYANMDITPSSVTHVKLLNRADAAESRLTNTKIEVCNKNGFCHLCGHAPVTGKGQWATIACENGPLRGNVLRLSQKNDCLQFCEVEIIGKALPCDHNCDDYHRFCPALTDKKFIQEYKALADSGALDALGKKNALPPTPSCDDAFYQFTCPKSCKKCFEC